MSQVQRTYTVLACTMAQARPRFWIACVLQYLRVCRTCTGSVAALGLSSNRFLVLSAVAAVAESVKQLDGARPATHVILTSTMG